MGAILQVVGDHSFVFRDAPRRFVWQRSEDGTHWSDLPGTAITNEQRLHRIHRLGAAVTTRFLRLDITAVAGGFPTLREAEFYADPQAAIAFPEWIVAVNVTHDSKLPGRFRVAERPTDGSRGLQPTAKSQRNASRSDA